MRQAKRLHGSAHDVEAKARHTHAAAQAGHGLINCALSRPITGCNVLHPVLDLLHHLGAVVLADGRIDLLGTQQLVRVDQPLVPGQVVDHVLNAPIDRAQGVHERATLDLLHPALREPAPRGCRRVGPLHLALGILRVGVPLGSRIRRRVVLDREVSTAQRQALAI